MGVDYRAVNGYIYISVNPVTDPAKIGERAEYFQKRAGYYYANWDELYAKWRGRMEALIAEITELPVPDLPEYEPDEVAFEGKNSSFLDVIANYSRALRLAEQMWQNHFEFLLLGYGAYLTFSDYCRAHLPDIPEQHIAQMIAGIDVLLFRPDAELRRLAKLAVEAGRGRRVRRRPHARRGRRRARRARTRAGTGSRSSRRSRTRGSTWPPATACTTTTAAGSTIRASPTPRSARTSARSRQGQDVERPTEALERERDRLAAEYGALLDDEARQGFEELLGLSRTVFPYVEEHKFYCDYWFLTRFYNKIREFGALLARNGYLADGEDIFMLSRHEAQMALEELCLMWATGGPPLGPAHWPPIVDRRRELLKKLEDWTPPPALGAMPESVNDPMAVMLWGVTPQRLAEWAESGDAPTRLTGAAASAGEVEGPARVLNDPELIGDDPRGRDPGVHDHLARVGARVPEDQGDRHRHRRDHVPRGDRLARVRQARGGRHRARHRRDQDRADAAGRRIDRRCDHPGRRRGVVTAATASLAELRSAEEPHFGGKSSALGELIGGGIPVPPGFGVSTHAFEAFLADSDLVDTVASALEGLDHDDLAAVRAASDGLVAAVRGAPIPEATRAEIVARYAELGDEEPAVAVRSSACGEDSAEATFAGQQETYLWVRGADAVCAAVRDCWASLYSSEALGYRARLGDSHTALAMGVAVQLMVDAEVAGVMFTCNPVSGDPSIIAINASWGLGSTVVGGEVTPDEFLISKVTGEIVRRAVNRKEVEQRPAESGGIVTLAVPDERAGVACLDEEHLSALVAVARTVEQHFGSHQDIEWALGPEWPGLRRPVTPGDRHPRPDCRGPEGQDGARHDHEQVRRLMGLSDRRRDARSFGSSIAPARPR